MIAFVKAGTFQPIRVVIPNRERVDELRDQALHAAAQAVSKLNDLFGSFGEGGDVIEVSISLPPGDKSAARAGAMGGVLRFEWVMDMDGKLREEAQLR